MPSPSLGVVVARFQTPYLHDGHRALLDYVCKRHEHVIVFLGCPADGRLSVKNPLDFYTRQQMLRSVCPEIHIGSMRDIPGDDLAWSQELDLLIKIIAGDITNITLYGGRDSVVDSYKGTYPTHRIPQNISEPATNARRAVELVDSEHFRRGMIYAVELIEKGRGA